MVEDGAEFGGVIPYDAHPGDAVAKRLSAVYTGVPGDVVRSVEEHREAATRDYVGHLRAIRDALAPYGKFKAWCEAAGVNYKAAHKAVSRAFGDVVTDTRESHSKKAVDAASTVSLPEPKASPIPDQYKSTVKITVIEPPPSESQVLTNIKVIEPPTSEAKMVGETVDAETPGGGEECGDEGEEAEERFKDAIRNWLAEGTDIAMAVDAMDWLNDSYAAFTQRLEAVAARNGIGAVGDIADAFYKAGAYLEQLATFASEYKARRPITSETKKIREQAGRVAKAQRRARGRR